MRPSEVLKKTEPVSEVQRWANNQDAAQKAQKRAEEERQKGLAPVGSLMFTEVERRIDVVIFRACLAHSVYEARRLVIHGDVLLNGKKVRCSSRTCLPCHPALFSTRTPIRVLPLET